MRQYGSFVVRWWEIAPGQQRLRIRHVQSDAEVTVAALAEAQAWMAARVGSGDQPTAAGRLTPAADLTKLPDARTAVPHEGGAE